MRRNIFAATLATLIVGFAGGNAVLAQDTTVGEKIDDVTLVTKIKADLLKTGSVDGLDVNVDAKEGRVTLSGWASNESERTKAEQIAKGTSGVKSVENKITLKTK